MKTAPLSDFQKAITFFLLKICPTMYILRKRSDFKFFEKQHVVTQKSNKNNKNNTLSKYAIFGIWHIPTYFAVGQWQPRANWPHFFWKGGWVTKIGSGWYLADFRPVEYSTGPKMAKNHNSKSQKLHFLEFHKNRSKCDKISNRGAKRL